MSVVQTQVSGVCTSYYCFEWVMEQFKEAFQSADYDTLLKIAKAALKQDSNSLFFNAAKQFVILNTSQNLWCRIVPLLRTELLNTISNDIINIILTYYRSEELIPSTSINCHVLGPEKLQQHTFDIDHGTILRLEGSPKVTLSIVVHDLCGSILTYPIELTKGHYRVPEAIVRHFSRQFIERRAFVVHFQTDSMPWIRDHFPPHPIDNMVTAYLFPQHVHAGSWLMFETCPSVENAYFSPTYCDGKLIWTMVTEHSPEQFSKEQLQRTEQDVEMQRFPADHPDIVFLMGQHWQTERDAIAGEATAMVAVHTHHYTEAPPRVYRALVVFLDKKV